MGNPTDAAKLLGAMGGKKGGRSKSGRKVSAVKKNLELARTKRWPSDIKTSQENQSLTNTPSSGQNLSPEK